MSDDDCPICYTKISIPIEVPICKHKFCFCCLKGACVDKADPLCPICRRSIDVSIFDRPKLVGLDLLLENTFDEMGDQNAKCSNDEKTENARPKKFWLYQGVNCWWRYEPSHERNIEDAFAGGATSFELCMCGSMYIINFKDMRQYRKDKPNNRRRIKHVTLEEMNSLNILGIAGMRCT